MLNRIIKWRNISDDFCCPYIFNTAVFKITFEVGAKTNFSKL